MNTGFARNMSAPPPPPNRNPITLRVMLTAAIVTSFIELNKDNDFCQHTTHLRDIKEHYYYNVFNDKYQKLDSDKK